MSESESPFERIKAEVASWEGVTHGVGRRGEYSFRVGRREVGHLHGDHAAHFMLPKDLWAELHAEGRIGHHPVFPEKEGPGARAIHGEDDVRDVLAIMRLNYDRIVTRYGLPEEAVAT
jgi:hypothetical protein